MRRASLVLLAFLAVAGLTAAPAPASIAQEEREGSQILRELEGGKLDCATASADDLEGERQAHVAMGRRYAGCGGGRLPAGFGQMMSAINGMGVMGAAGDGVRAYGEPGSMMYGNGREGSYDGDHFDGPSAAAMVGIVAVLIGAAAVGVLWLGRRRRMGSLDTLEQRFAAGELSAEDYKASKRLLEGG